jgi:hypothetical protein
VAHAATSDVVRQDVAPDLSSSPISPGAASAAGESVVLVNSNSGLTTLNSFVRVQHVDAARVEIRRVGQLRNLSLDHPLVRDYPIGTRIEKITLGPPTSSGTLTADAHRGDTVIAASDRTVIKIGGLIQIGGLVETMEVAALPATLPGLNPGPIVLRSPLQADHLATNTLMSFSAPINIDNVTGLVVPALPDAASIIVSGGNPLSAGDLLRAVTPDNGISYLTVSTAPTVITPMVIPLSPSLTLPQIVGAPVVVRQSLFEVRAIDQGKWGNYLRVGMELQSDALLTTTTRGIPVSSTAFRLTSAGGIEEGTELAVTDTAKKTTFHKVAKIDQQNDYLITLEGSTPLPVSVGAGNAVRTREYRFVVELLHQPDPANPMRDAGVIDREVFTYLSLDERHSRYFQDVIGAKWDLTVPTTTADDSNPPKALRRTDRRSDGESNYVRVHDTSATKGFRNGPVSEYEIRSDGTRRLILLPLAHGDDAIGSINVASYIGTDKVEPELRTGLFTMRNVEEISILSVPGQTDLSIQSALIDHCELARYRFAVLDGEPPPKDSLSDIQAQRQQFDTKYAALYHPWLLIPDPYPLSSGTVPDYPIPPSGHMLGIYARTDVERGVHKAPANEVVRGILGLQRVLNKEQHDILNPYPVNINVIRDFRENNRGIRVYGGRVITSDSDWKYVNVRRLLIFIEASVDRGLQWVVFEPNAEPLWARVRRSITNFLTLVWRNGALEGTKPEEAFFVKCDRTTMTQTDMDSGRLIVLVGVAPVKPAEFVIVRMGLWTAHADE